MALAHAATSDAKRAYNKEYYQTHKDYWVNYYKNGHGIGRGTSHTVDEKDSYERTVARYERAKKKYDEANKRYFKAKPNEGHWVTLEDGTSKWVSAEGQAIADIKAAEREMQMYKDMLKTYNSVTTTGGPWTHQHSGGGGKW